MKSRWLLVALLSGIPLQAWQATTPQAALEELATATKPEVIARHLPEPVQRSIEVLPKAQKQQVMDQLLELKSSQLNECTVRPAPESDAWEIVDSDGETKGRVRLANAFISGVDAILPLRIETDGNSQMFIVTMHLEDDEWRIDDFGPWEKGDLGLDKLVHQTTEMEKNEESAREVLQRVRGLLMRYAYSNPAIGYPSSLRPLTEPVEQGPTGEKIPLLDESYAADPFIKDGYRFRYLHTDFGNGEPGSFGGFEITAVPVEYGKTGTKSFLVNHYSFHITRENRVATVEDPGNVD